MLNVVKHLFADMLNGDAQFTNRSFAVAQDDKVAKTKKALHCCKASVYLTSQLRHF